MSATTLFGAPSGGIVGARQLVAIQTIDLGRLTHHPVPLVPSSLVAVSGAGPERDSNGSGKTTFLASLALLLGDPEWRVATTGGADALGLLFDPDLSGDAAGLYDPARAGYVAGVFAHVTADGNYDELTVWLRISADDSPRLAARWASGVHLVAEPADAATTWNALGRERQIGPTAFVEQLYGGTGRCLAYVTSRGNRDTDTSLMQLQARLGPSRIGSELIVLLGLEHLVDGERDLRAKLADAQQRFAARVDEHERREHEWAATLADIDARDRARDAIAEGKRLWQLRIARKLLDACSDQKRLEGQLAELADARGTAQAELHDVEARIAELPDLSTLDTRVVTAEQVKAGADERHRRALGDVSDRRAELNTLATRIAQLANAALAAPAGLTVTDGERRAGDAAGSLETEVGALAVADRSAHDAQVTLRAVVDHGETDPGAHAALAAAGVVATALVDGIALEPTARDRWEPLLAPWRGAFVVSATDRDAAIGAALPGTILVIADRGSSSDALPAGVVDAPPGTNRFLHALSERAEAPYVDAVAGVVVAGRFDHELCGRDAAIARARTAAADAERARVAAVERVARARHSHELAVDALNGLRAADELAALRAREVDRSQALAVASRTLAYALNDLTRADDGLVAARVQRDTAAQARDRLEAEFDKARERVDALERDLQAVHLAIDKLDVDGWRRAWRGTDDEAASALEGDDRREESLRKRATEQLVSALERLGVDSTNGHGAPTGAIADVIRARRGLDDDVPAANEVRRFDTVAQPLVEWLDELAEHDAAFREDVETERARWEEIIGAARRECETQADLLERHRDMVEQQIEAALSHVSARYGELDAASGGYGARLRWRSIRPEQPTDLWVWEVSPEWRRAHGGKWLPYTRQANSAMQKQHRTHLVLAALLAAENPAGRVLVIDEAGNDFGREHLRQVLRAFAHVARSHGVTVIAACQDKVLEEVAALGAAQLLLWFERLSDASALCRPTRVWGFDADGRRVELTRSAVEAGRLL